MSQKSSFAIVWHYAFHVKKCILKACVFLCHPVVRYLSARFSRVDVDRVAHEKTLDDLANNAQQWEVSFESVYLCCSIAGGSGKSFLIKAISAGVRIIDGRTSQEQQLKPPVIIGAPTGVTSNSFKCSVCN